MERHHAAPPLQYLAGMNRLETILAELRAAIIDARAGHLSASDRVCLEVEIKIARRAALRAMGATVVIRSAR